MDSLKITEVTPSLNVVDDSDLGTIKISGLESTSAMKSVNFGPGADLLMNPSKQKKGNVANEIKLDEINDVVGLDLNKEKKEQSKDVKKNFLFSGMKPETSNIKLNVEEGPVDLNTNENPVKPSILKNASGNKDKTKSDDGFKKFNNIPINPSAPVAQPKKSPEETLKEKFYYLRRLEAMEKQGVTLSKKYSMESPLSEMKGEYELIKSEKEKKSSVAFQGKMMMALVSGVEFLNNKFDPFDLKLDGWAEQVNENINEYDELFGELHEKYAGKAKIAPEIKLLFMLGGSAAMVHMTNTMFKSSMPGMDDILKQNPELMQQFTQAAVNTMGEQNPGFGNFMNMAMPQQDPPRGSPPGPPEEYRRNPPRMPGGYNTGRPDIGMSRGQPDFNDAENMEGNFSNLKSSRPSRPEMKGPKDLKDILSGLKTKTIQVSEEKASSVASITELNELKNTNLSKPAKKSRRKNKSDKNVLNLQL